MNFDLVPRRYRVTDEQIDDGDFQAIVTPLWWEVSIYDGETEMYDSLDRFTDQQKYVWAIQWYYSEVENGGIHQRTARHAGMKCPCTMRIFQTST